MEWWALSFECEMSLTGYCGLQLVVQPRKVLELFRGEEVLGEVSESLEAGLRFDSLAPFPFHYIRVLI